jgi:transposase-like protein
MRWGMDQFLDAFVPPFCPNPDCHFHRHDHPRWRFVRAGFFPRCCLPQRIQRYQCRHCRRYFSDQTFHLSYWLKRPDLLLPLFHRLVGCSGFRQIAREFNTSPSTVLLHTARLGRHCLLVHQQLRPRGPICEPLALDSFISFEFSQYWPTAFHLAAGRDSHFFYGFTESELRRSGSMTPRQRRRRQRLEARFGRPDPKAQERDVAELLALIAPTPQPLTLHTDEHLAYPRALARLPHLTIDHHTVSSRAVRVPKNPLFEVNLLDLLIRHSGANHKRETIAFSKRRQSAVDRLAVFLVWRNYVKCFSERKRDATPAMRLGLLERPLTIRELLMARRFPSRERLPRRWAEYYWRTVTTRQIPKNRTHRLTYAA